MPHIRVPQAAAPEIISTRACTRALADSEETVSDMDSPIGLPVKRRAFSGSHARACVAVEVRSECDADNRRYTRTRSRDRF